ncbi:MAG: NAD(P)H-dependent oxidoreductase subunit E [Dehalococcoidia bacterium]
MTEATSETTEEEKKQINGLLKNLDQKFSKDRRNLIPILQEAQSLLGYLPHEAMQGIAGFLRIPAIDVFSVVTFYNQFRLNPPGKHSIRVCLGTACHIAGGKIILDSWKRRLNIGTRETTPDRGFDLDTVACVGCCAMAPVTVIDGQVNGRITPTRVDGILLSYKMEQDSENEESR